MWGKFLQKTFFGLDKHIRIVNSVNFVIAASFKRLTKNYIKESYYFRETTTMSSTIEVPDVRRDDTFIEEFHGVKVPDPYRWLEDPENDEIKAFVKAQNAITLPFLEKCEERKFIKSKLTEIWNYPKYSVPFKRGSRYFFFMNTGLQNQSVMYTQDSIDGEPRVFLDPNQLSEDGTVSIQSSSFSEDGEVFAYGLSASGSDWISIHFRKVSTGEDYPEVLEKVKFSSMAWTHDHKGIFYGCYLGQEGKVDGTETTTNENQKLLYHRLDTPQSEDVLVAEFPDNPKWIIGAEVTDCGKFLILTPSKEYPDNIVYYATIPETIDGKINFTKIIDVFDSVYEYITNDGTVCLFRTNKDALNYRLIKIDLMDPKPEKWTTLIEMHDKDVLDWVACVHNDKLITCYMCDVKNVLQVRSLGTGEVIHNLPLEIGTISGYSGRRNQSEIFYTFTSFLAPGIIYHLDFTDTDPVPKVFREIKIKGIDTSKMEMKQVFYSSKDGTKVPMFIISKKTMKKTGSVTTLLYGYGGFSVAIQPYFSISRLFFMQAFDGIIAIPNIRGGGEYGKAWHNSGKLLNKQNVFNDFQAAAEYLISEKYTSPNNIVIQGGSNGGLLVGACVNQRPDLFKVAIGQCGVMDMLRYHKFTIGYAWMTDYGDPEEEKHFKNLLSFSPLHNVKVPPNDGQYPAVLLTTADHDDRVVPLHSFKFISELQYRLCKNSKTQTNPILIRIETRAGHGAGKPTSKIIDEHTDMYCFMMESMGIQELNKTFE